MGQREGGLNVNRGSKFSVCLLGWGEGRDRRQEFDNSIVVCFLFKTDRSSCQSISVLPMLLKNILYFFTHHLPIPTNYSYRTEVEFTNAVAEGLDQQI